MNQEIKLEELDGLLSDKRVFLVCGKSFDRLSIKENVEKACGEIVRFSDFSPNPVYEDVCKGVELFHKEQCNAILAVGGGSAIDVAKCIRLFAPMDADINYLNQEITASTASDILFIAIPTTAGSGSESSKHVVIYYQNQKQSISHENALPDYYILEPSTLNNLPGDQKVYTLMDALCQAIESWWSVNSTEESIGYSKKAIQLIVDNNAARLAYLSLDGDGEDILRAANYSGKAINITSTTAAHAMSYKLTTMFGIPHGEAVAICMTYVWEYLIDHIDRCIDPRGADYLRNTLDDIHELIDLKSYKQLLKSEMGIDNVGVYLKRAQDEVPEDKDPQGYRWIIKKHVGKDLATEYGREKEKTAEQLAESVNADRLKNYPVSITEDDFKDMYKAIIDEYFL